MNPAFAVKVVVVSASGALAPGPLTAATAALGARSGWRAGLAAAIGHTVVELPLVLAIAYGVGGSLASPHARAALGLAGGAFMLLFAALTLKAARGGVESRQRAPQGSALATGAALSLFNPFFLMWWLGVGSPLIAEALADGIQGILQLYVAHVWIDYAWLALVAGLGSAARLDSRAYRSLLAALALLNAYFAASTLASSLGWLLGAA